MKHQAQGMTGPLFDAMLGGQSVSLTGGLGQAGGTTHPVEMVNMKRRMAVLEKEHRELLAALARAHVQMCGLRTELTHTTGVVAELEEQADKATEWRARFGDVPPEEILDSLNDAWDSIKLLRTRARKLEEAKK